MRKYETERERKREKSTEREGRATTDDDLEEEARMTVLSLGVC